MLTIQRKICLAEMRDRLIEGDFKRFRELLMVLTKIRQKEEKDATH